jgi:hypothetical protein
MAELEIRRLLQNPLGQIAPAGQRGDIVRVSDGCAVVYLDPVEFEVMTEPAVRQMLAQAEAEAAAKRRPERSVTVSEPDRPVAAAAPAKSRSSVASATKADAARAAIAGSVTDPRRASRRATSLW